MSAAKRGIRAAVLGSPIGHSLSPVLHRAAYVALGLTWWSYDAIECDEAGLPALLDSCGPDWAGLSLTMPLKRAVLPLLDRIDPLVTAVGGANTVLFAAEQRLGYNTDVGGMVRALAAHGVGGEQVTVAARGAASSGGYGAPREVRHQAGPALILGGGATACAALAALREMGEQSAVVAVRNPERAAELRRAAERLGMTVLLRSWETADVGEARLVISTVPAGAADTLTVHLRGTSTPPEVVLDVVYHPWPTMLAQSAARVGAVVVGGFDLLLHQAALQVELMTGRLAPLEQMRLAGQAEVDRRSASHGPA